MQAMEQELQQLRQKVSGNSNNKRPHPNSQRTSNKPLPKRSPPTSSVAMTTSSPATSLVRESRPSAGVCDRSVAEDLVAQRKSDDENNVVTDPFSGIRIKYMSIYEYFF